MQQQKGVRSFSRGFFPGIMRFLTLLLAVVLSAGVVSAQTFAYVADSNNGTRFDTLGGRPEARWFCAARAE